jgi:hypothetical protein
LLSLMIIFLGSPQTLLNQSDLTLWRLNPWFRFFLKGMQNINTLGKPCTKRLGQSRFSTTGASI